jgi:hypothetical protein
MAGMPPATVLTGFVSMPVNSSGGCAPGCASSCSTIAPPRVEAAMEESLLDEGAASRVASGAASSFACGPVL